jgi:nicotinate-nucleotide--dimethylbenzimidazole phosphoribosyltransferase
MNMALLEDTLRKIGPLDAEATKKARERLEQLTMPHWALGRLMDMAEQLAGMTGSIRPALDKRIIVVMAGDHGVVQEGVSMFPQEVTAQMILNFLAGGAGINALSRVSKSDVAVVDMGIAGTLGNVPSGAKFFSKSVASGTMNMAAGPAMTREQAIRSVEAGIEVANQLASYELFGTGDMGIGNTTPSSAIVSTYTGASPAEVTGRGTGIDDARLIHKVGVIEKALEVNKPNPADALDVLAKVGGFEIGGIAGVILGAAAMRKPVIIDGFISTAGALIANGLCPQSANYMIAGHRSVEQGHKMALKHLNKEPLLDLDFRLGEGTGAAVAMTLVEAAVRVLTEVATFGEAAVSESH